MESHILESLTGILDFTAYFVTALILLLLFGFIYLMVTPYPEIKLIKEGKVAPAISFGGSLLGFVLPLASSISHSVSFVDMLIWGIIAIFVQIFVFLVIRFTYKDLIQDITNNNVAAATFLGLISLGTGILNAASMSY